MNRAGYENIVTANQQNVDDTTQTCGEELDILRARCVETVLQNPEENFVKFRGVFSAAKCEIFNVVFCGAKTTFWNYDNLHDDSHVDLKKTL